MILKSGRSLLRKKEAIFVGIFLIFNSVLVSPVNSEVETSIETKISIETSLEERLRKVLTEIAGTEKIIVIVNTELYSEKEKKELQLKPEEERKKIVLPGVPVKESIAERKIEDLLAPLDIGKTKTMIKRIDARIIVDKAVPEAVVKVIERVAAGLLGIIPERGDQLVVERMNFQKHQFYWSSLFYPPNLFWVIGIVLAMLFVFGLLLFLFNPFKVFSRSLLDVLSSYVAFQKEAMAVGGPGGQQIPEVTTPGETRVTHSPLEQAGERKPFWYVTGDRINQLGEILKKETPENIAIVLNYLDRSLMAKIFTSLPLEQQLKVAAEFATPKQIDPNQVKTLEQKIKDILDYSLGSEEALIGLLDYTNKETQEKIITALKAKDKNLASRIEKSVFSFEDIAEFEPQTIQAIVRRANLSVFAQILKTMPDNFRKKVLDALGDVTRRRIQQEIELGRQLPDYRLEEEKIRIVDLVRRLQSEGLVEIKK